VVAGEQLASFVTIIGAAAGVFTLIVHGVTRQALRAFRYRLEAIRDECVDAIIEKRLRRSPPVEALLNDLALSSACAKEITLARVLAIRRAVEELGIDLDAASEQTPAGHEDLSPDERGLVNKYTHDLFCAWSTYLKWGSPLGWILTPVAATINRVADVGDAPNAGPSRTSPSDPHPLPSEEPERIQASAQTESRSLAPQAISPDHGSVQQRVSDRLNHTKRVLPVLAREATHYIPAGRTSRRRLTEHARAWTTEHLLAARTKAHR
jgi:hypothetical protein